LQQQISLISRRWPTPLPQEKGSQPSTPYRLLNLLARHWWCMEQHTKTDSSLLTCGSHAPTLFFFFSTAFYQCSTIFSPSRPPLEGLFQNSNLSWIIILLYYWFWSILWWYFKIMKYIWFNPLNFTYCFFSCSWSFHHYL